LSERRPIEVAVIGGGCGAITAAFELTRPEHQGKYHVTVYQLGWRLGGKGASGRGPADRIEEHGLHVWQGFYENAFRLLRECYAELARDPKKCRFADWRDAFCPEEYVGLTERSRNGVWQNWIGHFPPIPGLPGDPLTEENPFSIMSYLVRTATLLRTLLLAAQIRQTTTTTERQENRENSSTLKSHADRPAGSPSTEEILADIGRLLKYGLLATLTGLSEAAGILEVVFTSFSFSPNNATLRDNVVSLLEAVAASAHRQLDALVENDDETRRLWELIDLVLAFLRGAIRSDLISDPRGFDALNDFETREWLRMHGASERSLNSAFLRALYDLALAYEDGDFRRPRFAAGQGMRGVLRMFFTYRGALFWKMRAGMGDVVFAPFYEVLKKRGVTFKFFHRLANVKLVAPDKLAPGERPYVEALEFEVQAEVKDGREYRPLIDVRGLPCWPSQPDYEQLVDGERCKHEGWDFESFWDQRKVGTKTLGVVEDFDFVVLGVGIGAIPYVCRELIEREPRWRAMVKHVKTVATQAFQVWLQEDLETLGWSHQQMCVAGFVQPFDTWADMRQLIPEESWPTQPRAIAYFCSALPEPPGLSAQPDAAYLTRYREEVRRSATGFLSRDMRHFWPSAVRDSGEFRWELLLDPTEQEPADATTRPDESRFNSQFWTANVNPSDRYVLVLPGSIKHRISPLDNTYDNLTIAGDWTACGFTSGCVEAAVISGRLAAHAISHLPRLENIIGYDHP
jgi:uncharacterized protein with NAD-binding domain and iron-sulfur cluster